MTHTAFLDIKAWETIEFLLESTKIFVTQLTEKKLLSKSRITRILAPILDIIHSVNEVSFSYVQSFTKLKRIKVSFHLVGYNHYVISRLIKNQQLTFSIRDRATRRELNLF